MSDLDELVTRFFTDHVTHDLVLEAERTSLLGGLWRQVADLGLPWVGIDERGGGQGGSLEDVLTVLCSSGRHAVPLPLLENHLAAWAVAASGGSVDGGAPWTIAPPQDGLTVTNDRVSGTLRDVAWGGSAARTVAIVGDRVVVLDPATAEVRSGRDLAGQPRDSLTFADAAAQVLPAGVTAEQLAQRGAVLRALQMAGAMQAVYDVTNRYVYEREQFGRPVGTFQAVRRHLVFLAQMTVMTTVSAERAAALLESDEDASFAAAAAKLLADQNAAVSVASGHQAHGAIGMTREYPLQNFTRRLNAWRGDWGTERELSGRIGAAVVDAHGIATIATDTGSLVL